MTLKELQKELAKREGGKSKEHMGNVRELVGLLSDLLYEDPNLALSLVSNGQRRAKKKKK